MATMPRLQLIGGPLDGGEAELTPGFPIPYSLVLPFRDERHQIIGWARYIVNQDDFTATYKESVK